MSIDAQTMPFSEVLKLPSRPADRRVRYGPLPQQFGDLRLPKTRGPHPVIIFIHGGCWLSDYDVEHTAPLTTALANYGFAVWSLEYRRVGNGGGWPATFDDIAQGTDHLRTIAARNALDLDRVIISGHSAGGHLALWMANRKQTPFKVRGVLALAPITDLAAYGAAGGSCGSAGPKLRGGTAAQVPDRYKEVSPIELPPPEVPVRILHGERDPIVPLEAVKTYTVHANATLRTLPEAGHFELIAPTTTAWTELVGQYNLLLRRSTR